MACYQRLDDYQEINGVSLLDRAVAYWSGYPVWLIARHSLRHSARANTVVVYTDTQKKVRVISFLPSDMMHVYFETRKVAK